MSRAARKIRQSKWTAEEFNRLYPVGTAVRFLPYVGAEWEERKTRSEAWESPSGDPLVMLEGRSGGCALAFIEVP